MHACVYAHIHTHTQTFAEASLSPNFIRRNTSAKLRLDLKGSCGQAEWEMIAMDDTEPSIQAQ